MHYSLNTSHQHALLVVLANEYSELYALKKHLLEDIPSYIPWRADWEGFGYFTVGGDATIAWGGRLTVEFNRDTDMDLSTKTDFIRLGADINYINRIIAMVNHYMANRISSLPSYWFFPRHFTYNSNSLLHGLLRAAGIIPYRVLSGSLPGWNRPVPESFFRSICEN